MDYSLILNNISKHIQLNAEEQALFLGICSDELNFLNLGYWQELRRSPTFVLSIH